MDTSSSDLRRATARRAYEMGRMRGALWTALVVLPLAGGALLLGEASVSVVALGIALYLCAAVFLYRGQVFGSAVGLGLLSGAVPLLAPLLFRQSGHCCIGGSCWSGCFVACIGGGVAAGSVIGWLAARQGERRGAFWLSAGAMAALTGSLGCACAGVTGVLGMAAALAVTSIPAWGVARARA